MGETPSQTWGEMGLGRSMTGSHQDEQWLGLRARVLSAVPPPQT